MPLITETRPWGSFTVLDEGLHYKVKRISALILVKNYHYNITVIDPNTDGRARREATVIVGKVIKKLKVDESIYIPKEKHSLANEGEELMQLIEVQVGDYLEEDDIVRLEDHMAEPNPDSFRLILQTLSPYLKFDTQLSFEPISKDQELGELVPHKAQQEMIELGGQLVKY